MLEQATDRLTAKVVRLREALERQNGMLSAGQGRAPGEPKKEESGEAYLNERAAAELAGKSIATIRRWRLYRKGPPHRKFGSAVRYSRALCSN